MGNGGVGVYIVVGFLGIAAAALAFAAEATRVKVTEITVTRNGKCMNPNSPASPLGYIAALLTLIAAILVSATARCGCCQRNPSNTSQSSSGIIFFVLSWVAAVIGIALLLAGASLNSYQDNHINSYSICYTVKPGVFAAGAALALGCCIFGLIAYSCVSESSQNALAVNQPGIALGQPQHAPPVGNPSYYDTTKQQLYV